MDGTPDPTAPSAAGYEFTPAENHVIGRTGGRVWLWGVLTLVGGFLTVAVAMLTFLTGGAVGAAIGVVYGLLALIPILVGLHFIRAGSALKAVVATAGEDVAHLLDSLENLGTALLIQIVAAIVWVLLFVLMIGAAVMIPKFSSTREKAYMAALKSDLRNIQSSQEIYYADDPDGDGVFEYAGSLEKLELMPSRGVTVRVRAYGERGWAATATHAELPKAGCAVFSGDVPPPTTVGGAVPTEAGVIVCD